jgi:hypothetical protein
MAARASAFISVSLFSGGHSARCALGVVVQTFYDSSVELPLLPGRTLHDADGIRVVVAQCPENPVTSQPDARTYDHADISRAYAAFLTRLAEETRRALRRPPCAARRGGLLRSSAREPRGRTKAVDPPRRDRRGGVAGEQYGAVGSVAEPSAGDGERAARTERLRSARPFVAEGDQGPHAPVAQDVRVHETTQVTKATHVPHDAGLLQWARGVSVTT